jgi:hypothetical protein
MKLKQIRALHDEDTITVYQAYNNEIASAAVKRQTFVSPPFKKDRMTWIKPSFLWMMYRCGWATKENQERVLAIKMKRSGFESALENACLSSYDATEHNSHDEWRSTLKNSSVRLQWDPEKDVLLRPLPYKSVQIGISGIMVDKFINEWIVQIDDITDECKRISQLINNDKGAEAMTLLPAEQTYILPSHIAKIIHSDQ